MTDDNFIVRDSLLSLMTQEEALIILSKLSNLAERYGVNVYELRFIGPCCGYFKSHPGERPIITLETKLSPKNKAWVFAHEIGHLFTTQEVLKVMLKGEQKADLVFGEDKVLITVVEQAANDWAASFINGYIRILRGLSRATKTTVAQSTHLLINELRALG